VPSRRIAVIGAGYVGLTTAVCLAHVGHQVVCSDISADRVAMLQRGEAPFTEQGLAQLLRSGVAANCLSFTTDNTGAVANAEFTFLCLPSPAGPGGGADTSYIENVATEIGPHLASESIVINKSTVPVGSTRVVARAIGRSDVVAVSNPEFLREGSAVQDFLHPDRIVIGSEDEVTAIKVSGLFLKIPAPLIITDPATAETIKYASNAFLATKISFANAIAALCEALGADVRQVVLGMGYDTRIGAAFLKPGPGWGGSCLSKDAAALVRMADDAGYDFALLKGAIAANEDQYRRVVSKAVRLAGGSLEGRRVALWGLTFKAGTDDLRDSPALAVAARLKDLGATIRAYDPTVAGPLGDIEICADPYSACEQAAVLILVTEWDEFRWLDFDKVGGLMAKKGMVDARNLLESASIRRLGFEYAGIGCA
jgi:UDPglucose 6-dehydrogenase